MAFGPFLAVWLAGLRVAVSKRMMNYADAPRQDDLDGRGNLSLRALKEFTLSFLKLYFDQVDFMSGLFEIDALAQRFKMYVAQRNPQA